MPRGYVQNPSLTVPTDPAFYDQLAGGEGEGILEGIGDVARGAFSYVQNRSAGDQREKIARQLLASLIEDGVPPEQAKISTIEFVTQGTQELMKAWENRKVVAANLKAREAETTQTQAMTAEIGPSAQASRAGLAATTAQTQAQTEMMPRRMVVEERGAAVEEGALGLQRSELDFRIDKETRDFALASDADRSGSIDPKEARDLLIRNRAMVREKVRKLRSGKWDEYEASEDDKRYRSLDAAGIDAEARRLTQEAVEDINFGNANAMDIAGGGGTPERDIASLRAAKEGNFGKYRNATLDEGIDFDAGGGGSTVANTYEEAVALIEKLITDPAQKARALQDAKAQFGKF